MPKESVTDVLLTKPKDAPLMAHNMGFEWAVSKQCLGLDLRELGELHDTMIMAYVLDTNQPMGLKELVRQKFGILQSSYKSVTGGLKMREISAKQAFRYGCDDSEYQWDLSALFLQQLADTGMTHYYNTVEMPLVPIIAEMFLEGAYVDHGLITRRSAEAKLHMVRLENDIAALTGKRINLKSYQQVSFMLYEQLKLPMPPFASSESATDKESLYWNIALHPVMPLIIEYRKWDTREKLYYKAYLNLINPATGRVHSQLRQTVVDTSRFSSSGPNLQQLAKRGDGVEVRELFRAPAEELGLDLVMAADMSQVELVLAGHRSKSAVLIKEYGIPRGDVHTATCMAIFHITREEAKANKTFRQAGKTTNFTLIYGGMAKRVYRQIKLDLAKMGLGCPFSLQEVEVMIIEYFNLYPEIRQMQVNDIQYARVNGYVKSLYGRRFYLPDIHARESWKRSKAERKATNSPIQGTCAELIKLAIINIYKERIPKNDAMMWASIHDENDFYLRSAVKKDVCHVVYKHMAKTPKGLLTNMDSELAIGPNFGQLKLYTEFLL
jgi:DNA polymerase-1